MVRRKKGFGQGDIVKLCLNPTSGREIQGEERPALILSQHGFNNLGMVLVAPITQGGNYSRYNGFTVTLSGTGSKTQGVILMNQVKMVDLESRNGKFIESANPIVVEDALAKLMAIIE